MKKLLVSLMMLSAASQTMAQELVGPGQTYTTLKQVFDEINAGNITGSIDIHITGSTTGAVDAALNASGTGFASYSAVRIYPVGLGGYTIDENIVLIGADQVTIDGRVNMAGTVRALTVTGKGATGSAVTLNNGADNNQLRYLHVIGGANNGIIRFGNTVAGCNFNKVSECLFEYANRQSARIAQFESGQFANGNNSHHDTLQNNVFKNFFCYDQTIAPPYTKSAAVLLRNYNYAWHIEGNSFIDEGFTVATANRCSPAAIRVQKPILVNMPATRITGNFIGGSQPLCQGAPLTATSTGTAELQFTGIDLESGNDTTFVTGNLITNIQLNGNKSINGPLYTSDVLFAFIGISCAEGIYAVRNNVIGGSTGSSLIVNNLVNGQDTVVGLLAGTTSGNPLQVVFENNVVGGLASSASGSNLCAIFGMYRRVGAGYTRLIGNTFGSAVSANSLHAQSTTTAAQVLSGIMIAAGDSCLLRNNTIGNLTNASQNATQTTTTGIWVQGAIKTLTIGNTIRAISGAGEYPQTSGFCVSGIHYSAINAGSKIIRNTVQQIQSSSASANSLAATGIYTMSVDSIHSNFVLDVSTQSTGAGSTASGIAASATCFSNNIISMGSSSRRVYGFDQVGLFVIYNSVYIGGTNSNFESAAFRSRTSNNYVVLNNIFVNAKQNSSGTTFRHFAITQNHAVPASDCNYNNYFVSGVGSGGALARANAIDYEDFATYQTAFGGVQNINSLAINPLLNNAGGSQPSDYLPAATGMTATHVPGLQADYFQNTRPTPLVMGALQSQAPLPALILHWEASLSGDHQVELNWHATNEVNLSHYTIEVRHEGEASWRELVRIQAQSDMQLMKEYHHQYNEYRTGNSYFRIRMTDVDGSEQFSAVKSVRILTPNAVQVYPNPCQHQVYIQLAEAQDLRVTLYNLDGKIVLDRTLSSNSMPLSLDQLNSGTYLLELSGKDLLHRELLLKK